MVQTLVTDCKRLPGRDGRWVPAAIEVDGLWHHVWVQLPDGWRAVPGWPGWGKLLPKGFTGITDPFKRWLWRRGGGMWSLRGLLHEIGHALQIDHFSVDVLGTTHDSPTVGRTIFVLHVGRYILRFGYRKSRIERGADAARDRALAWWERNGHPGFIPQEAFV